MMNQAERLSCVEAQRPLMFKAFDYIGHHPETGYREWGTQAFLLQELKNLGYTDFTMAEGITGFYLTVKTGRPGPVVCVMGELDSVLCPNHPDANPETGAAHACGHHCQSSALLGYAAALRDPTMLDGLCGEIRLMFVPAEELLEVEYRESLKKKGIIKYFGGKLEFMRRGFFDGVDLCLMLHTGSGKNSFYLSPGQNGCMVKQIAYRGKSAHAGGAPHLGINALYAANLGMSAVNSLRETFRDQDHIRFHPIVTGRAGAVNVIPDCVTMESYVRGGSLKAIEDANKRINRALAGAAACMGAKVTISDRPGYSPVDNDPNMYALAQKVMTGLVGADNVREGTWGGGSTDMGDISCVFPAIHPSCSGSEGAGHGEDYRIVDPESAVVLAAKYLEEMTAALLENDAAEARYILENKHTQFSSVKDFLAFIDQFDIDLDAVEYGDGKTIIHA